MNYTRTLNDSLAQVTRKYADIYDKPHRSTILHVNYTAHRLTVNMRGAILHHVKVQAGITLGTKQQPVVTEGNIAFVRRDPATQKWLCIEIRDRTRCADDGTPSDPVEVDTSADVTYSATIQDYASTLTPMSLFNGQFEDLGDLTLAGQDNIFVEDGYNGSITSGTTQEQLYLGVSVDRTMRHLTLYTTDSNVTLLVDVNGVNRITATRAGGNWTIQGASAGSSDTVAAFALPFPVSVVIGDRIRTAIQADGAVTGLAYGIGATG